MYACLDRIFLLYMIGLQAFPYVSFQNTYKNTYKIRRYNNQSSLYIGGWFSRSIGRNMKVSQRFFSFEAFFGPNCTVTQRLRLNGMSIHMIQVDMMIGTVGTSVLHTLSNMHASGFAAKSAVVAVYQDSSYRSTVTAMASSFPTVLATYTMYSTERRYTKEARKKTYSTLGKEKGEWREG